MELAGEKSSVAGGGARDAAAESAGLDESVLHANSKLVNGFIDGLDGVYAMAAEIMGCLQQMRPGVLQRINRCLDLRMWTRRWGRSIRGRSRRVGSGWMRRPGKQIEVSRQQAE